MNINPFDILKNAKSLQQEFGKMQEELADIFVTGSSGGGIVSVTLNGQFEMLEVKLDPITVDPRDITMLQDLIVAAHSDASARVKELLKTKLGPLASAIPGGFPGL